MKTLLTSSESTGSAVAWEGGFGTFAAWADDGNFEGNTVTLQMSPDGGTTWLPVQDSAGNSCALTAKGAIVFHLGAGCDVRAAVSGGGSPQPSFNARIF